MAEEEKWPAEASDELDAVRALCSALARLLSYPDNEAAAVFTDGESAAFLAATAAAAHFEGERLEALAAACADEAELPAEARAASMRRELSRLFYRPYAPVPLEGRLWIRRPSQDPEANVGEMAAVARLYRESGLAMRKGVVERPDALPTELDYVAFLMERETRFGREGNGAAALTWKRRRLRFVERHLAPLAQAVVEGIRAHTDWAPLQFWAYLLELAVARCMY